MPQTTRDNLQTQQALGLVREEPVPVELDAPVQDFAPSDPELNTAARETESVSFGDSFGASFRVDNTGYSLYRDFVDPRFNYDAGFDGVAAIQSDLYKGRIDALSLADKDDLFEELGGSFNEDHFNFMLSVFEKKQEDEELIMSAGGKGMLARLGANVIDPVDLAITAGASVVSFGAGGVAYKTGKWGRILSRAAVAGGANAGVEAVVSEDNPFRDATDVAFAAAAGAVMGGSLSFLTRNQNLKIEKIASDRASRALDDAAPNKAPVVVKDVPEVQARHAEIDSLPRKSLKAQMRERGLECS